MHVKHVQMRRIKGNVAVQGAPRLNVAEPETGSERKIISLVFPNWKSAQSGNSKFAFSHAAIHAMMKVHPKGVGNNPGLVIKIGAGQIFINLLQSDHIRVFISYNIYNSIK